jgi:hypothetical protein
MLARHTRHHAARYLSRAALLGGCAVLVASCDRTDQAVAPSTVLATTDPHLTMGSGSTPTFLGQGTYQDFDKVKRITDNWHVEVKAKGGLEILVRSFAYNAGSFTGWHKHPGPVFIQVIEGTVTFYEANDPCTPIVVSAGHGYIDTGENGHIGRNLTGAPAKDITIYLAPPGTQVSQLRIDMDEPPGARACSP